MFFFLISHFSILEFQGLDLEFFLDKCRPLLLLCFVVPSLVIKWAWVETWHVVLWRNFFRGVSQSYSSYV